MKYDVLLLSFPKSSPSVWGKWLQFQVRTEVFPFNYTSLLKPCQMHISIHVDPYKEFGS